MNLAKLSVSARTRNASTAVHTSPKRKRGAPYPSMQLLDLTLPSPAENLALDEALLEAAEAGELAGDVLRLWEMPQPAVIVGRSSRLAEEVDAPAVRAAQVPVLRRASGGAAVVVGPGCLMYSV